MAENTTNTQPPQNPEQAPQPEISPFKNHTKNRNEIQVFLVLVVILLLGLSGLFWYQNLLLRRELASLQPTSEITPSPESVTQLGNSWDLVTSEACGVVFSVPPKQEPYYFPKSTDTPSVPIGVDIGSGRYWQFSEGESSMFFFTNEASVVHKSDDESSGYISGGIFVSCAPNTESLTTAELNFQLDSHLISNLANQGAGVIQLLSTRELQMWDRDVREVRFTGGMFNPDMPYYLFATENYKYLVTKRVHSTTQSVIETTNKIFDELEFN